MGLFESDEDEYIRKEATRQRRIADEIERQEILEERAQYRAEQKAQYRAEHPIKSRVWGCLSWILGIVAALWLFVWVFG